jgi:hypothetical protein
MKRKEGLVMAVPCAGGVQNIRGRARRRANRDSASSLVTHAVAVSRGARFRAPFGATCLVWPSPDAAAGGGSGGSRVDQIRPVVRACLTRVECGQR